MGRYPQQQRPSDHTSGNRRIKIRGTASSNRRKQFGHMLESPSIFKYSLAHASSENLEVRTISREDSKENPQRLHAKPVKDGEDIVRSAW